MSAAGPGDAALYPNCAQHTEVAATYRCCECGAYLCPDCVEIGSHLIFCGLCGERAIEVDELERPDLARIHTTPSGWELASRVPAARKNLSQVPHLAASPVVPSRDAEPRNEPRLAASPDHRRTPAVMLVNHAIVPAATIAMVSALLFFLLDVRSAYLAGTEALKWVGFCFVSATVLIARYGRMSSSANRQGCYSLALAGATLVAMTVSPWANPSGGGSGTLINLLIVAAVWRFATRLTQALSIEGRQGRAPEPRLYGLERLRMDDWRRQHGSAPAGEKAAEATAIAKADANPGAPVARLAAAGIVTFALAEPFLLSAAPAVGERALGAMIVFLLSSGLVMAAGSGLGMHRRVRSAGGQASLRGLPGRVAAAGLLMVMLLALTLAVPGIEYRGSGVLRPAMPTGGAEEGGTQGRTTEERDTPETPNDTEARSQPEQPQHHQPPPDSSEERADRRRERAAERSRPPSSGFSKAASSLVGQMAELGRWLRYLVVVLVAVLVLWGLWRLLTQFAGFRRWLTDGFSHFGRRLLAGLQSFFRRHQRRPVDRVDPFANLESLDQLEPRAAILAAYGRLLAAFDLLGHARPERNTPYEFLASIPRALKAYAGPAKRLTDLYVKAAYSGAATDSEDRQDAFSALEEVRQLIAEGT